MKNKKLFFVIYIIFIIIAIASMIILSILGKKERIGYLSEFKINANKTLELSGLNHIKYTYIINDEIDEEGLRNYILTNESIKKYSYHYRVKYYDKVFRSSDIYGVYIDTNEIIMENNFIKEIKMEGNGSPFGNFVSDKIIDFEKIDNVKYILKIKKNIISLVIIAFVLIFILYYIKFNKEKVIIIINNINKYRFAVAGIIFIGAVLDN